MTKPIPKPRTRSQLLNSRDKPSTDDVCSSFDPHSESEDSDNDLLAIHTTQRHITLTYRRMCHPLLISAMHLLMTIREAWLMKHPEFKDPLSWNSVYILVLKSSKAIYSITKD
jgi:hypothetical protein